MACIKFSTDAHGDGARNQSRNTPPHMCRCLHCENFQQCFAWDYVFMAVGTHSVSSPSTPCVYLHTCSCLVSLGPRTSSLPFETQRLSCCLFAATRAGRRRCLYFSLCASLRQKRRDLRVLVCDDVILWRAKVRRAS